MADEKSNSPPPPRPAATPIKGYGGGRYYGSGDGFGHPVQPAPVAPAAPTEGTKDKTGDG